MSVSLRAAAERSGRSSFSSASLCFDIVAALLIILASRLSARNATDSRRSALEEPNSNIIWLSQPGPGGGGGGGGNQMKEPPRKAELPGKDKITVPVAETAGARGAEGATEGRSESGRAAEHPGR